MRAPCLTLDPITPSLKDEEDCALAQRIHEQQEEERRKAERCAPPQHTR